MNAKRKLLFLSFFTIAALFILPCLSPDASAFAAPPPNDNFANAQVITGAQTLGTNVNATKQPGEPNHANVGGKSVWYKWTAPANLGMTFDTLDSVLNDTLLAVYTGTSVNNLTRIASNDDWSSINGGLQSRVFFPAVAGTVYYIAVDGYDGESGSLRVRQGISRRPSRGTDFDGSNVDDITIFRPSWGTWFSLLSTSNLLHMLHYGVNGDVPVPADYDGDGKTDFGIFRPSIGRWYVFSSLSNSLITQWFGTNGDIPMAGEFSENGYADIAVFRPSSGRWYIRQLGGGNGVTTKQFGQNGDKPAPNDYDGDGKIDLAVFRPSTGYWYILNSFTNSVRSELWGQAGDIPVPGDYGIQFDGKADLAVFRPSDGTWYVLSSRDNSLISAQWGQSGDIPQPMNTKNGTDESSNSDFAVFRPSNGTWYTLDSIDGSTKSVVWGTVGDIPASSPFVVQP